tara:strand:+ start:1757 stop:1912 length:156 start_codon:yes stop_codon:yes gene_type:complete
LVYQTGQPNIGKKTHNYPIRIELAKKYHFLTINTKNKADYYRESNNLTKNN